MPENANFSQVARHYKNHTLIRFSSNNNPGNAFVKEQMTAIASASEDLRVGGL